MKTLSFLIILTILTLFGHKVPKRIDSVSNVLYGYDTTIHYIFYQDSNIKIYHTINLDTNIVFLIPSTKVYRDLAYFSKINNDNNFKIY